MSDLRDRRHEQTKDDIVAAALRLFAVDGYADVTMERIAEEAGVSRRTVYRRFPSKDDVLLEVNRRFLDAWDSCAAALPAGTPALARVEACCLAVAAHIDTHADDVLVVYRTLAEVPALPASSGADAGWVHRLVALVATATDPPVDDATAHVIAGAYLGAIDAMMSRWVAVGGGGDVAELTRPVLERLRPIWPE